MDDAVQVDNLVISRGDRTVLDHIGCRIRVGTVMGLLGPSGSGKTILMRAIVGVQKITSGQVTVLGSPAGAPELRTGSATWHRTRTSTPT
jgi:ABC-2 type transport system ATP-binding protein